VPGDLSSAAFLLIAALIVPESDVTVENLGLNPTRTGVLDALSAMGANLEIKVTGQVTGEPVGSVRARWTGRGLRGITVAGELALRSIDEIPALAVAAAMAKGTTEFCDLRELRVKESDRIARIARELQRAGVTVREATSRANALPFEITGNVGYCLGLSAVKPVALPVFAKIGLVDGTLGLVLAGGLQGLVPAQVGWNLNLEGLVDLRLRPFASGSELASSQVTQGLDFGLGFATKQGHGDSSMTVSYSYY